MNRCLGQCSQKSPKNCECVAATEQNKTIYTVGHRGFQAHILQDHTSCKDMCRARVKHMCQNGGHQWNEKICTCNCPTAPSAKPCNANQRWETGKCQCVCKTKYQVCPKRMKWNSSLCECQCTMDIYIACAKLRKATNPKICTCM